MEQTTALQRILSEHATPDIFTLVDAIDEHLAAHWQTLWQTRYDRLLEAYGRIGELAYGAYGELLFRPIHRQLKQAGLRPTPRFPGNFEISREWGPEHDRQRWMWSTITAADGAVIGTMVTLYFHDHTEFRLPRQPGVIALAETGKEAVVAALGRRSADFQQAREAKIEIEEYLRSLDSSQ